ncbi:hypothetical protein KUTeg_000449 [Tegillarca granosa]|uniref:ER membrane protein complex subunit 2 n=1 Tax=Tegillarca granosa TaxID=220873 RepID=A0ABQ9FXL3_TEGGR|nr:hypothetical protein KUTeg_000449 [Tegillarca granosa]
MVVWLWEDILMKDRHKLGDELWTVYEQVCIAALDCQRIDLAEVCIDLLRSQFPKSVRVERLEGMLLEAEGRYSKAEELYNAIIEKDETNMFARKRQVAILKAQNKIPEAINKLNKYLEKSSLFSCAVFRFMTDFEAWMELCDLYLSQQDYTKAGFCVEELIMSNPHNHLYQQKFAEIKYSMGDPDSMATARSYFAQAVRLNPNNVRALYGLFLVSIFSSCNLATAAGKVSSKEKQSNIKYAAWAAQQLKDKYTTVQPEEQTTQTRVLDSIEKMLESLTEKTAN